jgi:hypothetical protein
MIRGPPGEGDAEAEAVADGDGDGDSDVTGVGDAPEPAGELVGATVDDTEGVGDTADRKPAGWNGSEQCPNTTKASSKRITTTAPTPPPTRVALLPNTESLPDALYVTSARKQQAPRSSVEFGDTRNRGRREGKFAAKRRR